MDFWIFGFLDFWIFGFLMIFKIFHIRGWLIFVLLFLNERRATIQMYPYQSFKNVNTTFVAQLNSIFNTILNMMFLYMRTR